MRINISDSVNPLVAWERLINHVNTLPRKTTQELRELFWQLASDPALETKEAMLKLAVLLPRSLMVNFACFTLSQNDKVVDFLSSASFPTTRNVLTKLEQQQLLSQKRPLAKDMTIKLHRNSCQYLIIIPVAGSQWRLIIASNHELAGDFRFFQSLVRLLAWRFRSDNLQHKLAQSENRLQLLSNNLNEGMIVLDAKYRVVLVNRYTEELFGSTLLKLLGRPISEVLPWPEDRELFSRNLEKLTSKKIEFGLKVMSPKKGWQFFNVTINHLGSLEEKYLLILRDVTHFKALEQRKNEFISIATHELRTPLTAVAGYLNLLQKTDIALNEKSRRYLDRAVQATERLARLSEDLLRASQVEEDRITFNPVQFDLNQLVSKVTKEFDQRAWHKGLILSVKPYPDKLLVSLDQQRTEQIFTNLLDNAIKYTYLGSIKVTVDLLGDEAKLAAVTVADTGLGINGRVDRVFEKFHRAHSPEKVKEMGAGLGLFIVKSYVDKQGGKITVRSRPGRGSSFTVSFPIAKGVV